MHEMALAQNIIETIRTQVTTDLDRVTALYIDVGASSGVVPDSLDFGLRTLLAEMCDRKTNTDNVKIDMTEIPTIARCLCGFEYRLAQVFEGCPQCASFDRKLVAGMDVVIRSVDVDEEGDNG